MGVFGNHLFELRCKPRFVWLVRASLIDAHEGEQRRKQAGGGVFLFGYFILDKQNKVSRLKAKRRAHFAQTNNKKPGKPGFLLFTSIF